MAMQTGTRIKAIEGMEWPLTRPCRQLRTSKRRKNEWRNLCHATKGALLGGIHLIDMQGVILAAVGNRAKHAVWILVSSVALDYRSVKNK